MKLVSASLEKLAIRTIVSGTKAGNHMLAAINEDFFDYPPAKKSYLRIQSFLKRRGEILTWEELKVDPSLDERVRKELNTYKKKPCKTLERVKRITQSLDKYRRVRKLYYAAEDILTEVNKDSVDIDKLLDSTSNKILQARMSGGTKEIFTHFGKGANAWRIVKKILKDEAVTYLPTGIETFDSVNRGLPLGGVMIIAGTTGGGKSAMSMNMSDNMAENGAKTALLSLEMNEDECVQRKMCKLTQIPMQKIVNPKLMSQKEKRKFVKTYKEYNARLRKKNTTASFVCPDEDISMEEALYLLKPYGYDVIVIDYVGLLRGMDDEDMWRKLGSGVRFAKRFAEINKCLIIICAQLSEEGIIRYSRGMKEHANNMWTWIWDETAKETNIIHIKQQKCRNGKDFPFALRVDFERMVIRDLDENEREAYSGDYDDGGDNEPKKKSYSIKKKDKSKSGFKTASSKETDDEDYFKDL